MSGRSEAGSGKGEAGGDRDDRGASSGLLRVRWVLAGIGALLILISPLWAPLLMRRMAFFRVRRIEILGAHYVAASDILTRLHVDTLVSIWDSTKPLAARVAAHPNVETVVVGRKLPGTLVVQVTERVPVALVPSSGGFRIYDDRGVALSVDPTRVTVDAPVVSQRDTALLRLLGAVRTEMPALYARLSEVRLAGNNELVLQLDSGPVRAMRDVTLARLREIDPVADDLARRQIGAAEIDLRFRDQVIARLQ